MSQEKVDRYKEYKANRKENLEKERKAKKRESLIWKIVGGVLVLALVVALSVTAYNMISARIQARPDYERSELIIPDAAGIFEEETTEAETTAESESVTVPESQTVEETAESTAPADK